jgi:hypothetical protein
MSLFYIAALIALTAYALYLLTRAVNDYRVSKRGVE